MTSSYIQDPTTVPTPKATPSKYYVYWFCFLIAVFLLYHITAYQPEPHTGIYFFMCFLTGRIGEKIMFSCLEPLAQY